MLRKAFRETMNDKDFLAEASKSKLDVDPVSGEEVEKIVAGLLNLIPPRLRKCQRSSSRHTLNRQRKRSVCLSWISTGILSGQIFELDFDADSGGARLVMRQSGDSHEADSWSLFCLNSVICFAPVRPAIFRATSELKSSMSSHRSAPLAIGSHEIALLIVNALAGATLPL